MPIRAFDLCATNEQPNVASEANIQNAPLWTVNHDKIKKLPNRLRGLVFMVFIQMC